MSKVADDVARLLTDVVDGDTTHLDEVLRTPHSDLRRVADDRSLVVTREAVIRVLDSLLSRRLTPVRAQQWASFVRRGYALDPTSSTPIRPIDITYEPDNVDAIVEVVSRLDEVGDAMDGTIGREELQSLRASLTEGR